MKRWLHLFLFGGKVHGSCLNLPTGSYPLPKFCWGKNNDVL
jgi:hypothetical protein